MNRKIISDFIFYDNMSQTVKCVNFYTEFEKRKAHHNI